MFSISDDDKVDVSQSIPFDRQGFDLSFDLAGLEEAVPLIAYGDTRAGYAVSGLFQGQAGVPGLLAERGGSDLPAFGSACLLCLQVAKEQLVRFFYPLYNVLGSLRTKLFPVAVAVSRFQFCQMLHDMELIQVLPKPAVVPLVQGNAMVPDRCGYVDLPKQFPVSL